MAIPIKAQANISHEGCNEYNAVVLLTDGSLYAVDFRGTLIEISRNYAGGLIRESMKQKLREYHEIMRVANLKEKEGKLVAADEERKLAEDLLKEHREIQKLFNAFKRTNNKKDTHEERFRQWDANNKKNYNNLRSTMNMTTSFTNGVDNLFSTVQGINNTYSTDGTRSFIANYYNYNPEEARRKVEREVAEMMAFQNYNDSPLETRFHNNVTKHSHAVLKEIAWREK